MFNKGLTSLLLTAALALGGVAHAQLAPLAATAGSTPAAANDPSPQQIYNTARAGQLGEARQMIDQVLRDRPQSAKAHYIAAEVYARSGALMRARQELHTAEQLSPGLPFAQPSSVTALERALGAGRMLPASHGVSWGAILLILAVGALVLGLLRRRRAVATPYAQPYGANPYGANPYGPNPYPGGGYGPGYGAPMGGGSGLMGSLATGLAVGAGVAAGEELVDHALGGHSGGGVIPNADAAGLSDPGANADMGGTDFGVSDGSSWNDGGGGGDPFGGGGGGDPFGGGGDSGGGGDWS